MTQEDTQTILKTTVKGTTAQLTPRLDMDKSLKILHIPHMRHVLVTGLDTVRILLVNFSLIINAINLCLRFILTKLQRSIWILLNIQATKNHVSVSSFISKNLNFK